MLVIVHEDFQLCHWNTPIPPDVGAIDAISAIESMTIPIPQHTTKVSQMAPAAPPFDNEKAPSTSENSHVSPSTITYPTIEKNRNRRYCKPISLGILDHFSRTVAHLQLLSLAETAHITLVWSWVIVLALDLLYV
jgi:hypothetical protein